MAEPRSALPRRAADSAQAEDGVDLEQLRAKYAQPGIREQLAKEQAGALRAGGAVDAAGEDKLSKIRICMRCQAMGTVTKQYGYRVMQETCTDCNGEGMLGMRQPAPELTGEHARKQRITQLEASIASVDSLDELNELEVELRKLQPLGVAI
ncbi:hypothetical protein T492DRAFT_969192 [Pavlovales sp. CCMP2436]|nr:hypothetical protein T492DRAFT_969192 [Pavlovales sp. CCMP2436]